MGSIQEMPSMEMTSKSRDVEMHDVGGEGEGHLNATGAPSEAKQANGISGAHDPPESHHVSNGHLTPDSKGEDGTRNPEDHVDRPLPSVEKDEDGSPSAAAAEHENTPESERRETIQSSPAQLRYQNSASVPTTAQTTAESIKLEKEIARLNEVIHETSARAAQKVLKEKWRFFLFDQYDESHISFILRAGFKNANSSVTEKVLQDKSLFKELLLDVASKKSSVIEKVITNATAAQLHSAPQRVLDEAIAERLKTVSAKQLIAWLARADRLGYKMDDIIDEDDESVVPRAGSFDADMEEVFEVEPAPRFASTIRDPLLVEQEKNLAAQQHIASVKASQHEAARQQQQQKRTQSPTRPPGTKLTCPMCHVEFPTMSGYNYHINKKPCQKQLPVTSSKWWCDNCMQGFTTKQGMDYHKLKKVCSSDDIVPAISPSQQLRREAASEAQHRPPPVPSQPQVNIPSVPRPSFTSQPPPTQSTSTISHSSSPYSMPNPQQSRPQVTVQRPPLHAPTSAPSSSPSVSTPAPRKQAPPSDVRQSPSELPAEKLAALNRELQEADDRYQQQIDEIPADYTEEQRTARLISLKNANASRKSQIRKAHGVSLRLREKDKQARKVAGVTPPGKAASDRLSMTSMTSAATPTSAPPTSSFSPINTPPRTGPSSSEYGRPGNPPHPSQASQYNGPAHTGNPPHPSNTSQYNPPPVSSNTPSRPPYSDAANAAHLAATSSYRPPPLNASVRVQNPYMAHDPNTLSHALERQGPRPKGFGVMRIQDLASNPAPTTTNKRRRSPEDEGRPVPPRTSAGPPTRSYFAPNLFDQNEPARQGQVQVVIGGQPEDAIKRPQTQASSSTATVERDTSMTDAPPATKPTNTQTTAIEILSSSESESNAPPAPKAKALHPAIRQPAVSTSPKNQTSKLPNESEASPKENGKKQDDGTNSEDEAKEEPKKRSSEGPRRGFMAKRGGKH
jgi:hypothetical protein